MGMGDSVGLGVGCGADPGVGAQHGWEIRQEH